MFVFNNLRCPRFLYSRPPSMPSAGNSPQPIIVLNNRLHQLREHAVALGNPVDQSHTPAHPIVLPCLPVPLGAIGRYHRAISFTTLGQEEADSARPDWLILPDRLPEPVHSWHIGRPWRCRTSVVTGRRPDCPFCPLCCTPIRGVHVPLVRLLAARLSTPVSHSAIPYLPRVQDERIPGTLEQPPESSLLPSHLQRTARDLLHHQVPSLGEPPLPHPYSLCVGHSPPLHNRAGLPKPLLDLLTVAHTRECCPPLVSCPLSSPSHPCVLPSKPPCRAGASYCMESTHEVMVEPRPMPALRVCVHHAQSVRQPLYVCCGRAPLWAGPMAGLRVVPARPWQAVLAKRAGPLPRFGLLRSFYFQSLFQLQK
jgi:hypothetical protein